nr:immunoglobulin superfamily member 10-like isoform X2 [Onthophagus taurus]XP_022912581.1 immunoglobulin superfamily member 10-like isoform X3 [Onthophagus taurus]
MTDLPKRFVFLLGFLVRAIVCDCPRLCECKWRDGKESAVCVNANLTSIPSQLDSATQVIDLTNNYIPNLKEDDFSKIGLLNLQKIYVAKCKLKTIDKFAFRNLKNLVELDLSYNLITSVPSHVFGSIQELRELKLGGNPIQGIPNEAFDGLQHLIRLELSDCKISSINPNGFKGLEGSLTFLKLDNNKLKELPANSISSLRRLQGLELNGNPWNCSCALRPLLDWMSKQNVPFGVPPSCQFPERLEEKPWDKLGLDEFACVPEIFAYNSKTQGVEGKNVTMTCRITGIPEPSVRWLVKNRVIANLSGTTFSNGKKLYIVHLKNNSSNLTILTADLQDAGVYICSAENKAGKAEASVTLAVSRRLVDNTTAKTIFVSTIAGCVLACTSCLAVLCVYAMRKRRENVSWRRSDRCNEENYEKIELNNKVSEISVVSGQKKNGEYRVVPAGDTDQEVEDEEDHSEENGGKERKETKFWTMSRSSSPENDEVGRKTKKELKELKEPRFVNSIC